MQSVCKVPYLVQVEQAAWGSAVHKAMQLHVLSDQNVCSWHASSSSQIYVTQQSDAQPPRAGSLTASITDLKQASMWPMLPDEH